eukprot:TRINITY_DN5080_c0_g1_i3.p1 TRINITY_DN5080_c0_g1~~TRINITY_DN5080_c0_g1_i3.p1  ORF type:complete len:274 (-),score=51.52 TRINITY_DN5080_c0_g1_i3:113-907(-)
MASSSEPPVFDSSQSVPSYKGEIAVVTGGTTGIGEACCKTLAAAGAKVYNLDVQVPADKSDGFEFLKVDVSKPDELQKAIRDVAEKEGRLDHLISNAGVWCGGEPMENITEAEFDRVVGINVKGCFFAISAAVPIMRQQGGGSIVVIGSDQSLVGKATQNLYGMTKGAIAQLVKSCAVQYAPEKIRVNCVCPGTIDTPLMRAAAAHFAELQGNDVEKLVTFLATAQPYPRLGTAEEVAHTVAFVGKIPFMVGAVISVDGGYTAQ